jgi:hypothetical protein
MKDYFIKVNMKVLQILVLTFLLSFNLTNAFGQKTTNNSAILSGTVKLEKKLLEGAVIILRDEKGLEYSTKTDEKGKYEMSLPFGKYFIYSTVNSECWMCAEFYKKDFSISKKGKIKLNIILIFNGEG